jgi:hypothetical protein
VSRQEWQVSPCANLQNRPLPHLKKLLPQSPWPPGPPNYFPRLLAGLVACGQIEVTQASKHERPRHIRPGRCGFVRRRHWASLRRISPPPLLPPSSPPMYPPPFVSLVQFGSSFVSCLSFSRRATRRHFCGSCIVRREAHLCLSVVICDSSLLLGHLWSRREAHFFLLWCGRHSASPIYRI